MHSRPYGRIHNLVTCHASTHGQCHVLPWLIQFSGAVQSRFTASRETIVTEVSPIQPEESSMPLFKAIVYSKSWIKNLVPA